MGREIQYPLTDEMEKNLSKLLDAVNQVRAAYGKPLTVTSGYRPGEFNRAAGGAKNSPHRSCEAVDFRDSDGDLAKFCLANLPLLALCGLYMENPDSTNKSASGGGRWVHLQIRPTKHQVFLP